MRYAYKRIYEQFKLNLARVLLMSDNSAETPKEVYAIVDKKDPKPTTASTMTDVYADVVKKGKEHTELDLVPSTLSTTPEDAAKDKKGKISKTHGKGKKKGKGI